MKAQWTEAITDYLTALTAAGAPKTTQQTRYYHLAQLAKHAQTGPWDITAEWITQWCGKRKWSIEHRRGNRNTFLSFYKWAVATGRTTENIAQALPHVPAAKPRPRPAPERIYQEALHAADPREYLMLRLAAECGMRRAEVAQVHTRDLIEDYDGYELVVHGKGAKQRVIPIPDGIAELIKRGPAGHTLGHGDKGFLFPGSDNGHLSPRWVGTIVSRLLGDEFTMHKLRHRFSTRAYRKTRNIRALQEVLGHASVATTQIYTAVDDKERRAIVEAAG